MQGFPKFQLKKPLPCAVWWAAGYAATLASAVVLVYYWRVFYDYGTYSFAHISPELLMGILAGLATVGWAVAWVIAHKVKDFCVKAAAAIFCVGLLFAFVNPPLSEPDSSYRGLRAFSIAQGQFDFDGLRPFSQDINALYSAFDGAWTNSHDGSPIKVNPQTGETACISERFADYKALAAGDAETITRYRETGRYFELTEETAMTFASGIIPLLPSVIGIALVRFMGGSALAMMYGGRIVSLLCYTALCFLALKNCKRYRLVFLAFMMLPLNLFLAASFNWDSMLLGLYFFAASYYCKNEITTRDIVLFGIALAIMTNVKFNNILWLALPLVLPQHAWKTRLRKWMVAAVALGAVAVLYVAITLYNGAFISNYAIGRTIEGSAPMQQLLFILSNIPRYCAVLLGTLYENNFFFFDMGLFGATDLAIPFISAGSVVVLFFGASLSVHEKSALSKKSAVGLFLLAIAYIAAAMTGLYLTYTPYTMVRVVGMQARYLMPAFLMLMVLVAALLSHVLEPTRTGGVRAQRLGLAVPLCFGVMGALLLFQHYYVGPVTVV